MSYDSKKEYGKKCDHIYKKAYANLSLSEVYNSVYIYSDNKYQLLDLISWKKIHIC